MARVIGDLQVATADPVTGASHPDSTLSFLRHGQPWGDDVMTTFCHYVPHFTGPASARRWTAAHPGTFMMSLGDAAELGRRHAARPSALGPHDQARPGAAGARRPVAAGPRRLLRRPAAGRGPGRGRSPGLGRARAGASCPADRRHAGHPVAPAGLRSGLRRQRTREVPGFGTMTSP
jgi:hypothetical protein